MKEKPEDVEKFFWGHLRKDVTCLAEALSRSMEDAVLTVHLFLLHLHNVTSAGRGMLGSCGRSPASSGGGGVLTGTGVICSSFVGQSSSQESSEKPGRMMRAMNSFRALRPDQLEGMSRLGESWLQEGSCATPSALASSFLDIVLLLAVKKPNRVWELLGDPG